MSHFEKWQGKDLILHFNSGFPAKFSPVQVTTDGKVNVGELGYTRRL